VDQLLLRTGTDWYPHGLAAAVLLALDTVHAGDGTGVCGAVMDLASVLSPAGVPRVLLYAAGQAVGDQRRVAATVAKTVAKPLNSTRHTWTTLEYRPSPQTPTDGPGRLAHSCGSEGRARRVPDEKVDQELRRPLPDNTAGIATWLYAREPARQGDLTRKRSPTGCKQQCEQQRRHTDMDIRVSRPCCPKRVDRLDDLAATWQTVA
jgi:hypothetical protein